jgi:hypothetical protein
MAFSLAFWKALRGQNSERVDRAALHGRRSTGALRAHLVPPSEAICLEFAYLVDHHQFKLLSYLDV